VDDVSQVKVVVLVELPAKKIHITQAVLTTDHEVLYLFRVRYNPETNDTETHDGLFTLVKKVTVYATIVAHVFFRILLGLIGRRILHKVASMHKYYKNV
tara:strand:+ start:9224 stop:9520 length:297 start_codon:yes stop_codon:yes gene_type:complete